MRSVRFYVEKSQDEIIWLTIYSDMMTNLMMFFLMCYGLTCMSTEMQQKVREGMQDKFKTGVTSQKINKVIKKLREEETVYQMKEVIAKKELKSFTKLMIDEDKIKITLQNPVLFAAGSAVINLSKSKAVMREIATILQGLPNQIIIEGHTDSTAIQSNNFKNNWELSIARALTIERILESYGVDASRMTVAGYAEYEPLYPNDTEVGRAFNRRIEITVIR